MNCYHVGGLTAGNVRVITERGELTTEETKGVNETIRQELFDDKLRDEEHVDRCVDDDVDETSFCMF
jgi:hypothetical protein